MSLFLPRGRGVLSPVFSCFMLHVYSFVRRGIFALYIHYILPLHSVRLLPERGSEMVSESVRIPFYYNCEGVRRCARGHPCATLLYSAP